MQRTWIALFLWCLLLTMGVSIAQEAAVEAQATAEATPPEEPPEFPNFTDIVTDEFEKYEGYCNFYRKPNSPEAYLQINSLEQDLLIATTVSGGSTFTGWQWSDALLYWKRYSNEVALIQREIRYKYDSSSPAGISMARTYTDHLIASYPIVTLNGGSPVIDFSSFFLQGLSTFFGDWYFQVGDFSMTEYKVKAFPENIEIAVTCPDAEGQFLTLHYSFRNLPASDYETRVADDRLGYFVTLFKDFENGDLEEGHFLRFINRWNLKKVDANLKKSPVIQPILFYIESTVPVAYRYIIRESIEEWNKAFEKLGYFEAVQVRQQTDKHYADLDPADTRYNFIRWITSESPFAMGPSRVDPRTGEILDADIVIDDSFLHFSAVDYDRLIREEFSKNISGSRFDRFLRQKLATPRSQQYFEAHPQHPLAELSKYPELYAHQGIQEYLSDYFKRNPEHPFLKHQEKQAEKEIPRFGTPVDPKKERLEKWVHQVAKSKKSFGDTCRTCQMSRGKARELHFAALHFQNPSVSKEGDPATPAETPAGEQKEFQIPEEFYYQVLKETIMHEVGHTLGLRHNWKGSAWRSLEEINKKDGPADISASVMDYNPINIKGFEKDAVQGNYAMTTLGPYDYWAIEYGYSADGSAEALKKIASLSAKPEHAFASHEDEFDSPDPFIRPWDLGNNPIAYAKHRLRTAHYLLQNIQKRTLKKGEGFQKLSQAFGMILYEYGYAASRGISYLGGEYTNRDHAGDPDGRNPLVSVGSSKQREALKFVAEHILSAKAFQFEAETLSKLAPAHWYHWGVSFWDIIFKEHSYDLQSRLSVIQNYVLLRIFEPDRLHIIENGELKTTQNDYLRLPEIFKTVREAVWSELKEAPQGETKPNNRTPWLNHYRRSLQYKYIEALTKIALEDQLGWYSAAACALAYSELETLQKDIQTALNYDLGTDTYSRAHLEAMNKRIEKVLKAEYIKGNQMWMNWMWTNIR
jgi:hypothetical protein